MSTGDINLKSIDSNSWLTREWERDPTTHEMIRLICLLCRSIIVSERAAVVASDLKYLHGSLLLLSSCINVFNDAFRQFRTEMPRRIAVNSSYKMLPCRILRCFFEPNFCNYSYLSCMHESNTLRLLKICITETSWRHSYKQYKSTCWFYDIFPDIITIV